MEDASSAALLCPNGLTSRFIPAQRMAAFCSKNKETVAELFAGFFHFYAFEFNYRTDLITIAAHIDASPEGRNSTRASKAAKAAQNGWNPSTTKIAIQDPFESTFNVGHVVRNYGLQVSFLLCTITFYANLAHSLTRSP